MQNNSKLKRSKFRSWLEDLVFVAVVVVLIRAFIVQAYRIPSGSMENTLLIGDHLFACKFFFGMKIPFTDKRIFELREPRRGDIVIFRYPYERKDFVKRCIGIEGDIVEIRDKKVYVNNKFVNSYYASFKDNQIYRKLNLDNLQYQRAWGNAEFMNAGDLVRDNFGPVKVPPNCLFMMGDNRDFSFDSRYWGPLDKSYVLGKALILYFSWDLDPPICKIWQKVRWNRIGRIIH